MEGEYESHERDVKLCKILDEEPMGRERLEESRAGGRILKWSLKKQDMMCGADTFHQG
jgi:hypothetical protein